jgi:glucosamine kinase
VAYYLGIDGGGSKTRCVVGDEVSVLGRSIAGPSNITRVGEMGARESLHQAIREACASAGIEPRQIDRACVGVAGAGREEVAGLLLKIAREVLSGEVAIVDDMPIALEAAFGAGPGVVVIAGTGSFAYGRNELGRTARAGGWGFAISDEGSAHWIGRTAVVEVLRAIDQDQEREGQAAAEASSLFREMKAVWKLRSLDEFVRTANSSPEFTGLLPAITTAADAGDPLAQRVLSQAGTELSRLAGTVVRRLFKGTSVVPLAMAGGVFRHAKRVREVFAGEIRKTDSRIEVTSEVVEPVAGALQMARRGCAKEK